MLFVTFIVLGYLWGLLAAVRAPRGVPSMIFRGFGGSFGVQFGDIGETLGVIWHTFEAPFWLFVSWCVLGLFFRGLGGSLTIKIVDFAL